jgi:hypothetical protein
MIISKKKKNYPHEKYLNLYNSLYDESKIDTIEEAAIRLKQFDHYFNKFSEKDLMKLKSDLCGVIEETKQSALFSTFITISITLLLMIINSFKETVSSLLQSVLIDSKSDSFNIIVFIVIFFVVFSLLISLGVSLVRFFESYRKLSILKNLLDDHISQRLEIMNTIKKSKSNGFSS